MPLFAAFVPSPPLLVPELAGGAAAETEDLRAAAVGVAAELAAISRRWIVVGTGPRSVTAGGRGTYRGFGADVAVDLGGAPADLGDPVTDLDMPLAALTAGWLRGQVAELPTIELPSIEFRAVSADLSPDRCREVGRELAEELRTNAERGDEPVGLLVVADGSAAMTDKAPASFRDGAPEFQAAVDDALTAGDSATLLALTPVDCEGYAVDGRAPWQVLAGVFHCADPSDTERPTADVRYRGAPFGVSYTVGTWRTSARA